MSSHIDNVHFVIHWQTTTSQNQCQISAHSCLQTRKEFFKLRRTEPSREVVFVCFFFSSSSSLQKILAEFCGLWNFFSISIFFARNPFVPFAFPFGSVFSPWKPQSFIALLWQLQNNSKRKMFHFPWNVPDAAEKVQCQFVAGNCGSFAICSSKFCFSKKAKKLSMTCLPSAEWCQ